MTQMWKEIMEQPQALRVCMDVNIARIQSLAEEFRKREINHIFLAARGTSDHAALFGTYLIELLLGVPVSLASPSVFTLYNRSLNLKNSLVIGLSQSGQAADVIAVLEGAKESGALTASITNNPDSPLALCVHHHLPCSVGPELSLAATKTFLAQMMMLSMLTAEIAKDDELKGLLAVIPASLAQMLSNTQPIETLTARYRFMNECFVLARGINSAIARESALKVQETCYVRAMAYPTSDFYHGPMAMTDSIVPLIIFAPDGPTLQNSLDMINILRERGNDVLVVSDSDETCESGSVSIRIPGLKDLELADYSGSPNFEILKDVCSSFHNAVAAQVFACSLSVGKGLNPDVSRFLKKVTITL